jgi:hypothetical protein
VAQDDDGPETARRTQASRRDENVWTRDTEVAPRPGAGGSSVPPRRVDASGDAIARGDGAERYDVGAILGEGGMGEVRLCRDRRIGRDVAMKIAKSGAGSRPDLVARFLREVRVQGQLEHPGVVPVYDLVEDEKGRPVFTMKRVRGRTFEDVMEGLHREDADLERTFSRPKLLAAFSRVCLTIEFAHSRGVVHRDMKPANVMLGDFGEVYVLDWGIARIAGELDEAPSDVPIDDGGAAKTEAGALLGTPGYMSPEQARGEPATPRSDVYSLGAILFELVTLEPLHAGHRATELLVSTLRGVEARPSARATGAFPEGLDEICARATALDPEGRFASARELAEAIDSMLDGERDVERRRELASSHVEAARGLLAPGPGATDGTKAAMRELASALALDPTHEGALAELRGLLLDAGDDVPPEAERELDDINRKDRARGALRMGLGVLAFPLAAPLVVWMGVRDVQLFIGLLVLAFAQAGYAFWMGLTHNAHPKFMRFFIGFGFANTMGYAFPFGPYVLLPVISALSAASLLVSLRPNARTRLAILGGSSLAVLIPALLDAFVFRRTVVTAGEIHILPSITNFPPVVTTVALVLAAVGPVISANVLVGFASRRVVELERRVFAQMWRLRHLLPEGAAHRAPASQS